GRRKGLAVVSHLLLLKLMPDCFFFNSRILSVRLNQPDQGNFILLKMVNLTELELVRCDLERILHSICSLHNLQEIDLKDNNLKTIEEIISFQHLHCLVCLKLWYNQIAYIPIQIGTLTNLKRLYLNRNKIEKIPSQLFSCHKLCFLDLSHNNLTSIHPEVGTELFVLFEVRNKFFSIRVKSAVGKCQRPTPMKILFLSDLFPLRTETFAYIMKNNSQAEASVRPAHFLIKKKRKQC
uniref:Uncharacterized protein n=1 Tax=Oryzias sinensis TaxID=183150 RepID=A0A8C7X6M3_9TELE